MVYFFQVCSARSSATGRDVGAVGFLSGVSEMFARLMDKVSGGTHTEKYEILRRTFGYDRFQPGQRELIDAVLAGQDVLGIMPTGGGKSLCYQIPALMMNGLTVVICPLISLMKDQVATLEENGIGAACLNSSLSQEKYSAVLQKVKRGEVKILYVAPERLENPRFAAFLREREISQIAVDEAHCISQWGRDFRPSYRNIAVFVESLPVRPVITAFTATATEQVREDIRTLLGLRDPKTLVTGFDRPNLYFEVRQPVNKVTALLSLLYRHSEESGIIYCSTRGEVDRVYEMLRVRGIESVRYHAGLTEAERQRSQEDFQCDRRQLMVATNAFGMGIDKPNIRFVIHYNIPFSVEAYYQEAGRAGRDGEPAVCVLLYSVRDVELARFVIGHTRDGEPAGVIPTPRQLQMDRQLNEMVRYCQTPDCLRAFLLRYFGEVAPDRCDRCGNCLYPVEIRDFTVHAQMILSCVKRIYASLHYYVGTDLVIKVLRGSTERRVQELGLTGISTYGLMRDQPREYIRACVDTLLEQGYLFRDREHQTLRVSATAADILFRDRHVTIRLRKKEPDDGGRVGSFRLRTSRERLLRDLKQLRSGMAQEEGIPIYRVCSNSALEAMAEHLPRTLDEFLNLPGIGEREALQYGESFLEIIRKQTEPVSDRHV